MSECLESASTCQYVFHCDTTLYAYVKPAPTAATPSWADVVCWNINGVNGILPRFLRWIRCCSDYPFFCLAFGIVASAHVLAADPTSNSFTDYSSFYKTLPDEPVFKQAQGKFEIVSFEDKPNDEPSFFFKAKGRSLFFDTPTMSFEWGKRLYSLTCAMHLEADKPSELDLRSATFISATVARMSVSRATSSA